MLIKGRILVRYVKLTSDVEFTKFSLILRVCIFLRIFRSTLNRALELLSIVKYLAIHSYK